MSLGPIPAPPACLRGEARRAWKAIAPKLVALGLYLPIDRALLAAFCTAWARHLRAARAIATAPARDRAAWAEIRDGARAQARELAAAFLVLPKARVHLAELGERGEDLELRRLFTPGVAARRVPLTPAEARRLAAWNRRWMEAEDGGA